MLFVLDFVSDTSLNVCGTKLILNASFSRLLVRHPSTFDRLRKEVSSVMGDSEHPTREQIRKMPYLGCVIRESKDYSKSKGPHRLTACPIRPSLIPSGTFE